MDEAFHILSGGTLRPTPGRDQSPRCTRPRPATPSQPLSQALPPALDFFGATPAAPSVPPRKRARSPPPARPAAAPKNGGEASAHEDEEAGGKRRRADAEARAAERGRLGVRIGRGMGAEAPRMLAEIEDVGHRGLARCLREEFGFTGLTPVQRQVMPAMDDWDVLARAPTGSGKTLAYLVPCVRMCVKARGMGRGVRVVVVVPTRELAIQVKEVLKRLVRGSGVRFGERWMWIGTPGRLEKAIGEENIDVSKVACLVLDEADKLLERGFHASVDSILANTGRLHPGSRRHMFSATLPQAVLNLADSLLRDPLRVFVRHKKIKSSDPDAVGKNDNQRIGDQGKDGTTSRLRHRFIFAGGKGELGKIHAMRQLIDEGVEVPMLVFVCERERASELMKELIYRGIAAEMLHSGVNNKARNRALERFRSGNICVLVATDVLARGMDLIGVKTVVSYDCPESAEQYVHRAGRTARSGRPGLSIVLFTEQDHESLTRVAKQAEQMGAVLPNWMTAKRKGTHYKNRHLKRFKQKGEKDPSIQRKLKV